MGAWLGRLEPMGSGVRLFANGDRALLFCRCFFAGRARLHSKYNRDQADRV